MNRKSYIISVDLSLSLEDMIRRGMYQNEEEALGIFTEERFSFDRSGKLQYTKEVFCLPPTGCRTMGEWKARLMSDGWLHEGLPELLALLGGLTGFDLMTTSPLYALGSTWKKSEKEFRSPVLWYNSGARNLITSYSSPNSACGFSEQYALVSRVS